MNKNNLEIERKFLLTKRPDHFSLILNCPIKQYKIKQGYIKTYGLKSKRIREMYNIKDETFSYYLTEKTRDCLVREEIEKEISKSKYDELVFFCRSSLEKYRYLYRYNNAEFSIDIYGNLPYSILEIELESEKIYPIFPNWINNIGYKEITYNKSFYNENLSMINQERIFNK